MDFKKQYMYSKSVFFKNQKQGQMRVLKNTISDLKAMSMDPMKKTQVLSTLVRFQGQMSSQDYNEILANVKSHKNVLLDSKPKEWKEEKKITEQSHQSNVTNLKRLEREMRYR